MRIKTFEAPTMHEALLMAKQELGDDAVVLNTKHVKSGGMLGLGGSTKVELTAAVDDAPKSAQNTVQHTAQIPQQQVAQPQPQYQVPQQQPQYQASASSPVHQAGTAIADTPAASFAAKLYQAFPQEAQPEPEQPNIVSTDMRQLQSEVKELTSIVQKLLSGQMGAVAQSSVTDIPKAAPSLLSRLGVDEDIARAYLPECLGISDIASLTSVLAAKLQRVVDPPAVEGREVIVVVGPTGVGKTTTLAKLAAKFGLEQGKKVALVTADTYRIGAVEQLRTYARIMGMPLEIALTPEEVAVGVEKHQDKDVVLIDTVGRSQRSGDQIAELKKFVDAAQPTQIHLVVAASQSQEVQNEVVERFAALMPTKLIVTKLDESPSRGCLVNLPFRTGLTLTCTTAGQNVPQDIDFAEAGGIARLITEVA